MNAIYNPFLLGALFGLLLVFILLSKKKYDERQALIRGKAYMISFFIMIAYYTIYGFSTILQDKLDTSTAMFIGVLIAAAIHFSYCIWKDAYFSLNEDKKKMMIAFVSISIFNLVIGLGNLFHGEIIVDGVITYHILNLLCAILFLYLFIVLLVKKLTMDRQSE
jgi:hypothetical protein